jgi:hypothetical protein
MSSLISGFDDVDSDTIFIQEKSVSRCQLELIPTDVHVDSPVDFADPVIVNLVTDHVNSATNFANSRS